MTTAAEERRLRKIRDQTWYKRYDEFYGDILNMPDYKSVLLRVHHLVDSAKGYHYEGIAYSAEKSIRQLLADRGNLHVVDVVISKYGDKLSKQTIEELKDIKSGEAI